MRQFFKKYFGFLSLPFFYFGSALLTRALISRAHVGRVCTPEGRGEPARQRPQARPRARDRACPPRLAVFAAMAAAAPPAWLTLQPAARTLRAFSSAVSPATVAQKSRTRECLVRRLQALGRRGRNIGPMMAAAVAQPALPGGSLRPLLAGCCPRLPSRKAMGVGLFSALVSPHS